MSSTSCLKGQNPGYTGGYTHYEGNRFVLGATHNGLTVITGTEIMETKGGFTTDREVVTITS